MPVKHPRDVLDRTITVGPVDRDFTTIQEAIDFLTDQRFLFGNCSISVDAGTYDEAITFSDLFVAHGRSLTLQGDTRGLAGMTWIDGAQANLIGRPNGGAAICTLASAGAVITVTCAGGNPIFNADGWGSGDTLYVFDNGGVLAEYNISATLNNTITLTVAAPALGNDGTSICLVPNRRIVRTTAGPCIALDRARTVTIDGFYLESATGADCRGIYADYMSAVIVDNCLAVTEDDGFRAVNMSLIYANGVNSAWDCNPGFYAGAASFLNARYCYVVGNNNHGFVAYSFGGIDCFYAIAVECNHAFRCLNHSSIACTNATARQNNTGYYAAANGLTFASGTNANNNGNITDYSPAPGIPGYAESAANFGVLYAS